MAIDSPLNNLVCGYEYRATLRINTPLSALLDDGKISPDLIAPENVHGMAHGIWIPQIKTWRELGIDFDEAPESNCASDIGPVERMPYRNFLVSVRLAVEDGDRKLTDRILAIKAITNITEFAEYVRKLGGQGALVEKLFPRIVMNIPGINSTVGETLWKAGMRTPHRLNVASDAELLALPGVGKKSLASLRLFCGTYAGDTSAERTEGPVL